MNNLQQAVAAAALSLCAVSTSAVSLSAQNPIDLPSTANPAFELADFSLIPFMQPEARVQMFYGASEVGLLPFVANELSMRFDGPIPQVGAPGPFAIQQLIIRIGKTTVANPGANFAANLTEPLTEVFNGPWTYSPDNGSAAPHPWGGPNDGLKFPFAQNASIALLPGEWMVVDLTMIGNNIQQFGFAHALLDGEETTGGIIDGSFVNYGSGCEASAGATGATATVEGILAPGGTHFLSGQDLGANSPVLGLYGTSNTSYQGLPLPFAFPGTGCTLLTSADLTTVAFADATGAVSGTSLPLAIPADPAFSGIALYEQLVSVVPTANSFGLVFSDGVSVTLGDWNPLGRQTYSVAHDADANAAYGNVVSTFGYAMQLGTL